MSITLYYTLVTLLLAALIAVLLGAGFAWGCRLSELDEAPTDSRDG
ncbi:MAG: hypothetical protein R3266_10490 [Gemmatimonadota bacterium]|nr:hypothetical protein [Gemmatimonadota bacterium]